MDFGRSLALAMVGMLIGSAAEAQAAVDYPISVGGDGLVEFQGPVSGPDGALWFLLPILSKVGRMTTNGSVTLFGGFTKTVRGLVAGPDGALWVAEDGAIGRVAIDGTIKEFPLPDSAAAYSITLGSDGNLWFMEADALAANANNIGRITPAGAITVFPIPITFQVQGTIVAGVDGALWFSLPSQGTGNAIGRMTVAGAYSQFTVPPDGPGAPGGLTVGPDGALWFSGQVGSVGRLALDGTVTQFPFPTPSSGYPAAGITTGADGALWLTTYGSASPVLYRLTLDGTFTDRTGSLQLDNGIVGPDGNLWSRSVDGLVKVVPSTYPTHLFSAVLPATRSVEVGTTATAFATLINAGTTAATGCKIVSQSPVAAQFTYQTTDPATNSPTGTVNTPVTIAAGASQTFVLSFTPNAAFGTQDELLGYSCSKTDAAATILGVNTLLLSASATPVADLIALVASTDPGILDVSSAGTSGAFAVATANIGAAATITATTVTGSANLPVTITLCETNPTTSACLAPPAASVTTSIASGAAPTFGVFVEASQAVAFDPANNRIVVRFVDGSGVVRGSTSVAIRTLQ